MPSLETFDCVDDAVLWEASGKWDNFGQLKINDPIEIKVRWLVTHTDGQDAQGNKITFSVRMSSTRPIALQSILRHGTLSEVDDPPTGLCLAVSEEIGYDVKGRANRYEYRLTKFKDELPVIAPGTGS